MSKCSPLFNVPPNSPGSSVDPSNIFFPRRTVSTDTSTLQTDNNGLLQVNLLGTIGGAPRIITISNTTRLIPGFKFTIADITGFCSTGQPIEIVREDGLLIQKNAAVVLSAPYASATFQSDGSNIYITPSRDSQIFSPPTTFRRELALTGATEDREFLVLPIDDMSTPGLSITLFYNKTNAFPYVVCVDGTATISRMVVEAQNTVDSTTITPDAGSLAVGITPVYFTRDGTAAEAFSLATLNSSARIIFRIEGFSLTFMTPQVVVVNILSGGVDTTEPLVSIWGEFLPASYFATA